MSKRGRPTAPCCPSSAGSSQRDLDSPIPKELGLPSLEWGMLVRIEKRSPKWQWLKDKERGKSVKTEQKKIRGREWEPRVKQTVLLASPSYIGQTRGMGRQMYKRRKTRGIEASPLRSAYGIDWKHDICSWSKVEKFDKSLCGENWDWNMFSCRLSCFSCVQLFVAHMDRSLPGSSVHRISRQEYWSELPCTSPGDLPDSGTEPRSLMSPAWIGGIFITSTTWKPHV